MNNKLMPILALLLIASISFAQVATSMSIDASPTVSSGFNLSSNQFAKTVIQSSGSILDAPTTLANDSQVQLSSAGLSLATLNLRSALGPKMQFKGQLLPILSNCAGTLSCSIVYEFTPTVDYSYSPGDFTPDFVIGSGSFNVVSIATNYSYPITIADYGMVNVTLNVTDFAKNISKQVTATEWAQVGTHQVIASGWTDISQLKLKAGQTASINVTVSRDSYSSVADVQPKAAGQAIPQWGIYTSFWGSTNCTVGTVGANTTITLTTGTCWVNFTSDQTIQYLVVSGGGSGGTGGACGNQNAGGGGAGGINFSNSFSTGAKNYSLTVGAGGASAAAGTKGKNGSNSTFNSSPSVWISPGGGGGGSLVDGVNPAFTGGSGGGGGADPTTPGGHFAGQGNDGGAGFTYTGAGGGGGGYNTTGTAGGASNGGAGGSGFASSISGSYVGTYACGGGGSVSCGGGTNGAAGCGTASAGSITANTADATANSGSGTGGASNGKASGNAGSGIIIINFLPVNPANTTAVNFAGTNITPLYTNNATPFLCAVSGNLGNATNINGTLYKNTVNISSVNLTCAGTPASCANATNQTMTTYAPGTFGIGDQLIFSCNAHSSTNFAADSGYSNSSTYTVVDDKPVLKNLMLTPNSSVFTYTPIYCNMTVEDNDTGQTNVGNGSWYRNGVNQTGQAFGINLYNGTANWSLYAGTQAEGDNISCGVVVNDSLNVTAALNTSNVTIGAVASNLTVNYTPAQWDMYTLPHYLNITMAPGTTGVAANITVNGTAYPATFTQAGNIYFFTANPPSPQVTGSVSKTITWTVCGINANSAAFCNTTSYSVQYNQSGLYVCASPTIVASLNISAYDGVSGASINATITDVFNFTLSNGTVRSTTFSGTNNSLNGCLSPSNESLAIVSSEVANASGYQPTTVSRHITANSTLQPVAIYLYNSSAVQATLLTVNQAPALPLAGATITIEKYTAPSNYTLFQSCTTSAAANCLVYLTPNSQLYRYNVSFGSLNQTFGPEVVTCTSTATTCFRTFTLGQGPNVPYFTNPTGTCTYTNSTLNLSCSSNDSTATIVSGNLSVYKVLQNASIGTICSTTYAGASGTLNCTLPSTLATYYYMFYGMDAHGNVYYFANGYIDELQDTTQGMGTEGLFVAFLCFIAIVAVGLYSMLVAIILSDLAIVALQLMGVVNLGWEIIVSYIIISMGLAYILSRMPTQ